jgi:hypothetical protein
MANHLPNPLDSPPFPLLTWEGSYWEARIGLSCWQGVREHRDPQVDSPVKPYDSTGLSYLVLYAADDVSAPPTPEQAAAYLHLLDQQKAILDAVLQALLDLFPAIHPRQIRELFSLNYFHVHVQSLDGLAYVGFEFESAWDEEFGLALEFHASGVGVMTHAGRVIASGDGDVASEPPAGGT